MAVVPAALSTLRVLRHLAAQAGPVPAASIARELGLPRSTVYHLLDTLSREGFVTHAADSRRYGLGLAAYELAAGYSRQAPLARTARGPLAALVDRCGHSGHVAVLHGAEVVYVVEERAVGRPALVTDVGVRLPAHLTASGRALLAALPVAHVRAAFAEPGAFVLRTGLGPADGSALEGVLAATRARGWADERDEVTAGRSSVAVAVRDRGGHPVAALAVTFGTDELANEARDRLAATVGRTARDVAVRLGSRAATGS